MYILPDDCSYVCITTEQNLLCLTSCKNVLADGTFEYAPEYFLYLPLVYFFLKNKLKNTYISVGRFLIGQCEKLSLVLRIETLHLDFEIGPIEATKEVFPAVQIFDSPRGQ